jgi:RNA polymerase sigma-70 factor (ECF subfamily)
MSKPVEYLPLSPLAERELVEGLRRGDAAAYRQVFDRFSPRITRIICRLFSDAQLARDVVQTTFLIVVQKIVHFDGRSSLLTWMTRIAIHEGYAQAKKQSRRVSPEQQEPIKPSLTPEDQHSDRELSHKLLQLLSTLPEDKRTALLLFEVEGFSVSEIAEITGEPKGTLLARLSRTRAQLQKDLAEWCTQGLPSTLRSVRGREHA